MKQHVSQIDETDYNLTEEDFDEDLYNDWYDGRDGTHPL